MPAKYKLVYFNGRGRAEGARLLFAQAGVEYEDCRLTGDEFKAMKGDVNRMYGKNETDTTRIDIACECVTDIFNHIIKVFFEKDEAKKAEISKNFMEKDSVAILTAVSNGIKKNSEGKGFCVGNTMTLADIVVFGMTELISNNMPPLLEKYPVLKDFNTRMKAEPKIAAWLAKRPETSF